MPLVNIGTFDYSQSTEQGVDSAGGGGGLTKIVGVGGHLAADYETVKDALDAGFNNLELIGTVTEDTAVSAISASGAIIRLNNAAWNISQQWQNTGGGTIEIKGHGLIDVTYNGAWINGAGGKLVVDGPTLNMRSNSSTVGNLPFIDVRNSQVNLRAFVNSCNLLTVRNGGIYSISNILASGIDVNNSRLVNSYVNDGAGASITVRNVHATGSFSDFINPWNASLTVDGVRFDSVGINRFYVNDYAHISNISCGPDFETRFALPSANIENAVVENVKAGDNIHIYDFEAQNVIGCQFRGISHRYVASAVGETLGLDVSVNNRDCLFDSCTLLGTNKWRGNTSQFSNCRLGSDTKSNQIWGSGNIYTNCYFGGVTTTIYHESNTFMNCYFDSSVVLDTTSSGNMFVGCRIGNYTDNGTDNTVSNSGSTI